MNHDFEKWLGFNGNGGCIKEYRSCSSGGTCTNIDAVMDYCTVSTIRLISVFLGGLKFGLGGRTQGSGNSKHCFGWQTLLKRQILFFYLCSITSSICFKNRLQTNGVVVPWMT